MVALTTSLLGYTILTWVPFPALKQIACFAIVGICTAFASVQWLLPALLVRAPRRSPQRVFAGAARLLGVWRALIGGRGPWGGWGLLLVGARRGGGRLPSGRGNPLLVVGGPLVLGP